MKASEVDFEELSEANVARARAARADLIGEPTHRAVHHLVYTSLRARVPAACFASFENAAEFAARVGGNVHVAVSVFPCSVCRDNREWCLSLYLSRG